MRIIIHYESSWRNSFLDGSNDEPLPKKGRNFVASMTELGKAENFHARAVSHNTVMGVLCRLIGDQRKLYQARQSDDYYFANLENQISFVDTPSVINHEIAYIRNMKGSTDQNSFTGMIQNSHQTFNSDYSKEFWGVLWLSLDEIYDFCHYDSYLVNSINDDNILNPIDVLNRSLFLNDLKSVKQDEKIKSIISFIKSYFSDEQYIEKNDLVKPIRLYSALLYIQLNRLKEKYEMSGAVNKRGKGENTKEFIFGYSKRGFNGKRDFMKNFITGEEKIIYGNPYIRKESVKGEGKINHTLTKASGQLEIHLDIDTEQAKILKQMIDNAGVSSFYLGKKGLAYVDDIRLR
ncbi:Uncharacterised protein [Moraxella lacunata]|uniref:Cas5fv helical domain-containing protein n=1 Tax=Moraxella lacunata TaxID=477 RepID=A0A378QL39_MORLA|nr:type I-Fv CRISPR-associated protein Cas5fv [Moraxella lacunata]STZ01024.1 Uncharacterised protein [Moraxella lacunata]